MGYGNLYAKLLIALISLTLLACGGGGGGGTTQSSSGTSQSSNGTSQSSAGSTMSSTSSLASSSSSSASSNITPANSRAISRADTPRLFSDYMDVVLLSKYFAESIANEDYFTGLNDGTYTDTCEGGKGSYELKVSNGGNQVAETYSDCLLTVSDSTGTSQIIYNGKETAKTTRRENTDSTVVINWTNFSVASPGETAQVLNGSLTYDGLLYFNPQITYVNVLAKVKASIEISDGSRSLKASNINLSFNFPAIFDRYAMAGGGYRTIDDPDFHLITTQITSATGSIELADMAANFQLSTETLKLNFSNEATAKAYAQATDQGFYLQWDEQNDGLLDANVFLTANKYSALSDNRDKSTNQIDFTRYQQYYPTLPPNHYSLGQYQPLNLSRGASVEINVQEMFTDTTGALLSYEIDNQTQSSDWEQLESGRFSLSFPNSLGYETFELSLTAVDALGNRSPAMTITVKMNDNLADTDNDGILDVNDPDIDNDGVGNWEDKFPKDASESRDTDDDGIGDNADPDRDGDGFANEEDDFPNDLNCHSKDSGDEYGCYLTGSSFSFSDDTAIIYFLQTIKLGEEDKLRIIRFDTLSQTYLSPSPILELTSGYTYFYAYNAVHNSVLAIDSLVHRLYLVDLDSNSLKPLKDTSSDNIYPRFSDQGYFALLIAPESGADSWTEIYDYQGQLVDTSAPEASDYTRVSNNFQKNIAVPFCKYSASINETGKITQTGNPDDWDKDICQGNNQVSANQKYTFPESRVAGPKAIYNLQGDQVLSVYGNPMLWFGDAIAYKDTDAYLKNQQHILVLDDFEHGNIVRYNDSDNLLDNLTAVGNHLMSFNAGGYLRPKLLMLFNNNLDVVYDSREH